ncbi:MAG: endonuclease Q family protein [Thermoproteota archaeon]
MRVIADLHIHSCYSRATSKKMHIKGIARFAKIKGLTVVGTGDFTHPKWFREIKEVLVQDPVTKLYQIEECSKPSVYFMLTTEVSTIFRFENEVKKIHHLILTPNIETAIQISERLAEHCDLSVDGRPTLKIEAPQLVEEVMEVSEENMVIPAHIWTPWFSVFGAFSGFDSIKDCYQDMTKYIFALETGLSSDPSMNWRLSKLDKYSLISNSDSHSFWPWRIGREANVLELNRPSYRGVKHTIQGKDREKFQYTIETFPSYGKYHWTGHRKCDVSLSPEEAMKLGNICPVCRGELTKGVDHRVEELADRPSGFKPKGAKDFIHLLPLSEIIKTILNISSPYAKSVWSIYNQLIERFGDEYTVLMDTPKQALSEVVDKNIVEAIVRIRRGEVRVVPGYDGVYGRLLFFEEENGEETLTGKVHQSVLTQFTE